MNRRRFLALVAAGGTALALGGCSTGQPAATGSAAPTGEASGSGAFPATVATKFGDVTIEKKPTRVVALGWGDAEDALELGVQPVGASDWLGFGGEGVGPWLKGRYTTPPQIIATMEPSYEAIAALKPDLILDVKGSGDAARHERLASIAPTVGVPAGGDNYLTASDQQLTMIATALGETDKGRRLLDDVDKKFAAAVSAHPAWKGKTATAATKTSEGWGAYTKGDERVAFLGRLGFTQNPSVDALPADGSGFSVRLSVEKLDTLDADLIVGFPIFIPSAQLTGDAAFQAVPAVKAGHSVIIDGDLANAFSLGSPAARSYAIDNLVPKVEAAIGK
ncbi:iron-siderophore ABC transporter substrate-binding protein [Nigerium massiliense]|uniref:iron-siderophore ABC transporter substrate-binding protein n=1 Tax=Nigerium massiliense TaxID=1522317 RepID=UPI00058C0D01|nr:iron-siderophore ABC transporter substrate-binding protein [Nigerium massiliense]